MPGSFNPLLWASSVADVDSVKRLNESKRYGNFGMLIVLMGIWAYIAVFITARFTLELAIIPSLGVAALFSGIIVTLDRLIIGMVLEKDTLAYRFKNVLLARGLIAIVFGLVIAHTTLTYLYADDISKIVAERNRIDGDIAVASVEASATEPATIANNLSAIAAADQRVTDTEKQAQEMKDAYERDLYEVGNTGRAANGNIPGLGDVAGPLLDAYNNFIKVEVPKARTERDLLVADLTAANTNLSAALSEKKDDARASAESDGLSAESAAFFQVLRDDKTTWLYLLFFVLLDLVVSGTKALWPASAYDRERRAELRWARRQDKFDEQETSAANDAMKHVQGLRITEYTAGANSIHEMRMRKIEQDRRRSEARDSKRHQWWKRARRRKGVVVASGATLTVLVIAAIAIFEHSPQSIDDQTTTVVAGNETTRTLADGEKIFVPDDAVTNDEPVIINYGPSNPEREGYIALSKVIKLETSGSLVKEPNLSFPVPNRLVSDAEQGLLDIAFVADSGEWTSYPSYYDQANQTLTASLTHFSDWAFWEWDWSQMRASVSQAVGEFIGKRAPAPTCNKEKNPLPAWYNGADIGISDQAGIVLRSCAQGHAGDDVLDIRIVNNRNYGIIISHQNIALQYGGSDPPESTSEVLQRAMASIDTRGDRALYIPPLSNGFLGIKNPGPAKTLDFRAEATPLTVGGDVLALITDDVIQGSVQSGLGTAVAKTVADAFTAGAITECGGLLGKWATDIINNKPGGLQTLITSAIPNCMAAVVTYLARADLARGIFNQKAMTTASNRIKALRAAGNAAAIAKAGLVLTDIVQFFMDKLTAESLPGSGLAYGFRVTSRASAPADTDEPASEPNSAVAAPTSTGTPPAADVLDGQAAPSVPTLTGQVPAPATSSSPPPLQQQSSSVPPASSAVTSTSAPPSNISPVLAYDNYGPAIVGQPVCSGNPNRPESMPGGKVSQEFVVPAGVTTLTDAVVQIDPNPALRVRATLYANGSSVSSDAIAVGDTKFLFQPQAVIPGEKVVLELNFESNEGKLTTVYAAGSGLSERFSIANSCPDTGSSFSQTTTSQGLRATVTGR